MNVLSPLLRLSLAPTRVKILSVKGILASLAGTKLPMCAIKVIKAVCRNIALLPLMLGPVKIINCNDEGSKEISFGI